MAHFAKFRFGGRAFWLLLVFVLMCGGAALKSAAQGVTEPTCPNFVQAALETIDSACEDTGRNQACYGNVRLDVEAQKDAAPFTFEQQGDKIDLAAVRTLTLSSLNEAAEEWGVALLKVQANLPDTLPGQNVTFLLFGDVHIENAADAGDNTHPMQSFRFQTGVRDSICSDAPDSGMLIQTPEGAGKVTLTANGVEVTLGSTAYLQAEADHDMVVNVLEGQGEVTAQGVTQVVAAGQQVSVPIDADLQASGPPDPPHPYNLPTLDALPVTHLEQPTIIVAPNESGTKVDISAEGSVEASSTFSGFPASRAVDGDRGTSWFSTGPGSGGSPSIFTWTGTRDDLISTVTVLSNAQNTDTTTRTGFGFASVTVQVLDSDGNVVFEETVGLDGTPDPDVTVNPGVVGRTVVLTLAGHEDPSCGGFSELQIEAVQ